MKNAKIYTTCIFTLIVFLATFKQSFFFGYYIAFTENFIENFCENKDKPELQCDGKCFLSDLIEKKNTETPEIPSYVEGNLIFFFSENNTYLIEVDYYKTQLLPYYNLYQYLFTLDLVKPPNAKLI